MVLAGFTDILETAIKLMVFGGETTMSRGKSIELFLADGTPGGIVTAEISGWTGRVTVAPREKLTKLYKREEAKSNGVYILFGDDPESINSTWAYIGRTENFVARLSGHDAKKKKWQEVVVISSFHDSFNEGHWGEIESQLVSTARLAERCSLDENRNNPQGRKLSEAQQAAVEDFIDQVKMVLPILGLDIFRSADDSTEPGHNHESGAPVFEMVKSRRGINAKMKVVDGEFFLLKGSTIAATCALNGSAEQTKRRAQKIDATLQKLILDGSLIPDGEVGHLTRDLPFKSPSGAADIAAGTSANGRIEWKTAEGRTYADWESHLN
ncbi:GIY-YIG nuclease family protein [Dermabacteraceae bacterium P7006]